jgi:diguanylate cyclase (GGDEF)-like protein
MPRASHILPILLAAIVGVAFSIAAWYFLFLWESRAAELDLKGRAQNIAAALQSGMNTYFDKIVALRALFESAPENVGRTQFDSFAGLLLDKQPAILSASWVPRVTREQRAAHELAATREGNTGYQIRSVTPRGLVPAPQQDEYFPVFYATMGGGRVIGIDLRDGGLRQRPLDHARDGNEPAASETFMLQIGAGNRRGFFLVLPVYRQGLPHETVDDRRRNLVGFVQGVFQTSVMVETILGDFSLAVDVYLFEPSQGADALPVHVQTSLLRTKLIEPKPQAVLAAGPHWKGELKLADVTWTIVAVPVVGLSVGGHAQSWIVLAAGLLLSTTLVAYLWSTARQSARLVGANRTISELARTDALTGLTNRREFVDRLAACFEASRRGESPFAVLYFDLDHFKQVNDTLGHPAGDALLRQVAERLANIVRKTDLVARFGGDEFAVLQMQALNDAASATLAAEIVRTLAASYMIQGNEVHITASLGISRYSLELSDPEAIMIRADLALYRAKADGRNCFRFHGSDVDHEVRTSNSGRSMTRAASLSSTTSHRLVTATTGKALGANDE